MIQSNPWAGRSRLWSLVVLVATAPVLSARGDDPITQAALLDRMLDVDRLYSPDPAGERPFLYSGSAAAQKTDDGWSILAEISGPGAIQTLWTEKSDGELRIVTDGQPAVDGKWADFYAGGIDPFGAPVCFFSRGEEGGNCWLPMGFSKDCKVLAKGNTGAFSIGGTNFAPGTQVARFDGRLDATAIAALERVAKAFKSPLSDKQIFRDGKTMPISTADELKSKAKVFIDIESPCIVRALYVSITDPFAPREAYAHHHLVLRVYYDGEKEASIETPLSAFFGSGFDRWPYKSAIVGTDLLKLDMPVDNQNESWFMYSYLPIPITKKARFEIENLNSRKIGVMLYARAERTAPPAGSLRFFARYRWFPKAKPGDLTLAEFNGKGRVVGSVVLADCPPPTWWGSGAIQFKAGGAVLSAADAAAWYGNVAGFEPQRHGFNGVTLRTQNGKYSAYRWFVGDSLTFQNGAKLVFENMPAEGGPALAVGHVVHWYGEPGAKCAFKPLKAADFELPGLRLPGAVEIEGNLEGDNWGSLLRQTHVTGVELSGEAAVNITTTDKVTAIVRAPSAGDYVLKVRMVPGRSFKPVKFFDPSGKELVELAWQPTDTYIWELGRVKLAKGENKLGIQCTEKASIDCWILEPAGP